MKAKWLRTRAGGLGLLGVAGACFVRDLLLHSGHGKHLAVVMLGHYAPVPADASSFLDEQDAAAQIELHVEPIEAEQFARRIDRVKMHGVHTVSLASVFRISSKVKQL